MQLSCPACGAQVFFKSRFSVFGVCSFCQSTLVRHDINLEALGKMTEMPQDMSPLQIGTTGVFEGSRFEVVGRQRVGWESGSWNEWFLHFDSGRDGWLADAQGFYMLSFQVLDVSSFPELSDLNVSARLKLNGIIYTIEDIRENQCIGSEGELPVKSIKGRKSTGVDLTGPEERFGNIDYGPDETRLFFGKYVDFETLGFMNLKEIDGW